MLVYHIDIGIWIWWKKKIHKSNIQKKKEGDSASAAEFYPKVVITDDQNQPPSQQRSQAQTPRSQTPLSPREAAARGLFSPRELAARGLVRSASGKFYIQPKIQLPSPLSPHQDALLRSTTGDSKGLVIDKPKSKPSVRNSAAEITFMHMNSRGRVHSAVQQQLMYENCEKHRLAQGLMAPSLAVAGVNLGDYRDIAKVFFYFSITLLVLLF